MFPFASSFFHFSHRILFLRIYGSHKIIYFQSWEKDALVIAIPFKRWKADTTLKGWVACLRRTPGQCAGRGLDVGPHTPDTVLTLGPPILAPSALVHQSSQCSFTSSSIPTYILVGASDWDLHSPLTQHDWLPLFRAQPMPSSQQLPHHPSLSSIVP